MAGHICSFRDVIKLWPSAEALAGEAGFKTEAIHKWSQRGRIPAPHWLKLVATPTARAAGLTVELLATLAGREAGDFR